MQNIWNKQGGNFVCNLIWNLNPEILLQALLTEKFLSCSIINETNNIH